MIKNEALNGLQTIAHIGYCSIDHIEHRALDIGMPHNIHDVAEFNIVAIGLYHKHSNIQTKSVPRICLDKNSISNVSDTLSAHFPAFIRMSYTGKTIQTENINNFCRL
jgi:hypothetical protein